MTSKTYLTRVITEDGAETIFTGTIEQTAAKLAERWDDITGWIYDNEPEATHPQEARRIIEAAEHTRDLEHAFKLVEYDGIFEIQIQRYI